MKIVIFIVLSLFISILFCCSSYYHKHSTIDGKYKSIDKFRQWPKHSTSYKRKGNKIVIDTVAHYVVSKSRYKESIGCFHYGIIRQKTITYNAKHKKIEKLIIRNGKRKTITYLKNYDYSKINIAKDGVTNSKDTLRINIDTIKPKYK